MKIVEEFYTLQGEGKYLGVPSWFIRTTGCNLRCQWANPDGTTTKCDTPYTSFNPEKGTDLNITESLRELRKHPVNHVVITGGEPLLQPDLTLVCDIFKASGYQVTIETNATQYKQITAAFISMSPKLSSSYAQDNVFEKELHAKNNNWKESARKYMDTNLYQFKFVYNDKTDLEDILLAQKELKIPSKNIYLMPQGITTDQFKFKEKEMFDVCMKYGFNYTPRMHIDVWGNKRGI
jgi:7-carboxy-7-deazaguanine synthase